MNVASSSPDASTLRVVAILRGLEPDKAVDTGATLVDAGIGCIEVPLNSPDPLRSIETLARVFSDRALIGAGTVLDPADVDRVADAGGRIIVSPGFDRDVVERSRERGLISAPGFATASEAFAAIGAGAHVLKAFPCEMIPPAAIKAWRAVLPPEIPVVAVGGISADTIGAYAQAGCAGFGIGSWLFTPDREIAEIGKRARACMEKVQTLFP